MEDYMINLFIFISIIAIPSYVIYCWILAYLDKTSVVKELDDMNPETYNQFFNLRKQIHNVSLIDHFLKNLFFEDWRELYTSNVRNALTKSFK